ncbi:MAG: alginate lyase family protein [Caulobacter sp.]|nr:alginate lyase family protein [Caulobacter sp.]
MIRSSACIVALILALCAPVVQAREIAVPALAQPDVCKGSDGTSAAFDGRRTFRWSPDSLAFAKAHPRDPSVALALAVVMKRADEALAGPVYSVMDKTRVPPSGDKHDYISVGPYWWPDPSRPNGEPYVRRDGEVNPERSGEAFDVTRLEAMSGAVEALSLAYYFTDDARYATKAAQLLRTWFLDPATRMNPNAKYAQGVPGRTPGRAEGVLDTFRLLRVIEGVGLLAPSKAISTQDQRGLEKWFADYTAWMLSDPNGREEQAAANNHGAWFDYQLSGFALFSRQDALARRTVSQAGPRRIKTQIEPNGTLPRELQRTRALHYSYFALEALVGVADFGRCVGLDLWRYRTGDGRSLKAAFDFLAPYVGNEAAFPYRELRPKEAGVEGLPLFAAAATALDDAEFAKKAESLAQRYPASQTHLVSRLGTP